MNFSEISHSILNAAAETSAVEWLIFITAILYVLLAGVENSWCWLFGIISSALSVYLCYTGQLFLESILSVFYVVIGFYGWYQWKHGSKEKKELRISSASTKKLCVFFLIGFSFWLPIGVFAESFSTQALPYVDAFVTSFSIVATYMAAKKLIQNWMFWIVIDAVAVYLYAARDFNLIALLYFIYTLIALVGYFSWKKKINVLSV
ncbi:MAG: nicotinamide mononucleotide transporter [Bacteroidia bacterium]|nr:nicotinamide mononucleotide transporter [Bacteroidia bacterium]